MNYMKRFAAIIALLGTAFLFPANSSGVEGNNQPMVQAAVSARTQHLQTVDEVSPPQPALIFSDCCVVPGDANHDGACNISDAVYLIEYIFRGGPPPPCLDEGDVNADCGISIGDPVYLVVYVFKGGPAPICGCIPPQR